jgi:hypothetical protein
LRGALLMPMRPCRLKVTHLIVYFQRYFVFYVMFFVPFPGHFACFRSP